MRTVPEGDRLHFGGCCQFEIEWQHQLLHQRVNIAVGDMTAILPKMSGNPVGARLLGQFGCPHRVRIRASAGIPDRRYMVNIDTKPLPHRMNLPCLSLIRRLSSGPGVARPSAAGADMLQSAGM